MRRPYFVKSSTAGSFRCPKDDAILRFRVSFGMRCLDARPQDFAHVSDLAALTGLSASHAQALFSRATGVPFRRYRLWRRMAVVMMAIDEGATLTQAAFEAGFSSSSHLSAAFGQMFGVTLWTLRARSVRLWRA